MEQQEQSHARMSFAEREQFRASLKVRLVTLELMPSFMAMAFTVVVSVRVMGSSYSRLWSVGVEPSTV